MNVNEYKSVNFCNNHSYNTCYSFRKFDFTEFRHNGIHWSVEPKCANNNKQNLLLFAFNQMTSYNSIKQNKCCLKCNFEHRWNISTRVLFGCDVKSDWTSQYPKENHQETIAKVVLYIAVCQQRKICKRASVHNNPYYNFKHCFSLKSES